MRNPALILCVDDTPENLEILRVRLEANGYEVAEAVDGEDGLEKARALKPDLILLDVMMPKLDGIAVVKELKADTATRTIPVILVTAKSDTRDVVAGLDAGGDDYLSKPFEHAALLARVRSMLRQKALHDKVEEQAAQMEDWNRSLRRFLPNELADLGISAVTRMTGRPRMTGSALSALTTAMPSSLGIITSRRMRSGFSSRALARPSSPSTA